jgi:hypothetical protein
MRDDDRDRDEEAQDHWSWRNLPPPRPHDEDDDAWDEQDEEVDLLESGMPDEGEEEIDPRSSEDDEPGDA